MYAFARKSNATPRRMRPISIIATGKYSAWSTSPWAMGNTTNSRPTPSTSQVSLASQGQCWRSACLSVLLARGSSKPTPRS